MSEAHSLVVLTKVGSAYVTDEGAQVPEHALLRATCSCGWQSPVWYSTAARVEASFGRHIAADK